MLYIYVIYIYVILSYIILYYIIFYYIDIDIDIYIQYSTYYVKLGSVLWYLPSRRFSGSK